MNPVQEQERDHLSLSLIDPKRVHDHVQGVGGEAAGQDQNQEEGVLYQKRNVKGLQNTGPSLGKEKGKDLVLEIIAK